MVKCANKKALCDIKKELWKYFTEAQIDAMLTDRNIGTYNDHDISEALLLHSFSSKAYRCLREKKNVPLPSVSTLNRRVAKLDLEPGLLLSVLQLLNQKAETMSEFDRLCVLSFDETSLASDWSYDKASDTLYMVLNKNSSVS